MSDPLLTIIVQIVSITTAALGLTTIFATRILPWLRAKLTSRTVTHRLGESLMEGQVERAIRYYVEPMCQAVDPAEAEELHFVISVRQKLFKTLDQAFAHPTKFRHIFLLADSGMGKTSAVINYYAHHLKKTRRNFEIEVVPLGIPNADERISAITDKSGKVLFLDALDEDTLAIANPLERLHSLLNTTKEFRGLLITCQTQLFEKDEDILVRTGVLNIGGRRITENLFYRIYLSPFGDREIRQYIEKLYPAWRPGLRKHAFQMVNRIPELAVRPMLLAHVNDIVRQERELSSSVELYHELVEGWLQRERNFVQVDHLRRFSEFLAVDIYLNRAQRGAERVTLNELQALAQNWEIPLELWALTGRSLLNRDSEGNYKFSHRSIMEYLVVAALLRGDTRCISAPWTDLMKRFFYDLARSGQIPLPTLSTPTNNRPTLSSIFPNSNSEILIAELCQNFASPEGILVVNGTTRRGALMNESILTEIEIPLGQSIDDSSTLYYLHTLTDNSWLDKQIIRGARFHVNGCPYNVYICAQREDEELVVTLQILLRYLDRHVILANFDRLTDSLHSSPAEDFPALPVGKASR